MTSFMLENVRILSSKLLPLALGIGLTGCTSSPQPAASPDAGAAQRRQLDSVREQLTQIPLPSKTRYLAVKTLTTWANPYLTVQGNMVTLHVTLADANTSTLGVGGMLRPVGARRQDLNVRVSDLPAALNAVPENTWPYGRVIAIEEAHDIPAADRPQVRRTTEAVIKSLSDLGVVVYEWNDTGSLLR